LTLGTMCPTLSHMKKKIRSKTKLERVQVRVTKQELEIMQELADKYSEGNISALVRIHLLKMKGRL